MSHATFVISHPGGRGATDFLQPLAVFAPAVPTDVNGHAEVKVTVVEPSGFGRAAGGGADVFDDAGSIPRILYDSGLHVYNQQNCLDAFSNNSRS